MKRDTVGRVMDAIGWAFMIGGILAHTVNHLTGGPATDSVGLRMFIGAGCLLLVARILYDVMRHLDEAHQSRLAAYRAATTSRFGKADDQ